MHIDYETPLPPADDPSSARSLFKEVLIPVVFLTLGLLIYAAQILFLARDRAAARSLMSAAVLAAAIQTATGIIAGYYRGYFVLDNSRAFWSCVLKLAAIVVFATAFAGIHRFMGGGSSMFLLYSLLVWTFETTTTEACVFVVICIAVRIAVYWRFSLL